MRIAAADADKQLATDAALALETLTNTLAQIGKDEVMGAADGALNEAIDQAIAETLDFHAGRTNPPNPEIPRRPQVYSHAIDAVIEEDYARDGLYYYGGPMHWSWYDGDEVHELRFFGLQPTNRSQLPDSFPDLHQVSADLERGLAERREFASYDLTMEGYYYVDDTLSSFEAIGRLGDYYHEFVRTSIEVPLGGVEGLGASVAYSFTDTGKGADHTFGSRSAPKAQNYSPSEGDGDPGGTDTETSHPGSSGPGLPNGNGQAGEGGGTSTPATDGPLYGPVPPPDHQLPRPETKQLPVRNPVDKSTKLRRESQLDKDRERLKTNLKALLGKSPSKKDAVEFLKGIRDGYQDALKGRAAIVGAIFDFSVAAPLYVYDEAVADANEFASRCGVNLQWFGHSALTVSPRMFAAMLGLDAEYDELTLGGLERTQGRVKAFAEAIQDAPEAFQYIQALSAEIMQALEGQMPALWAASNRLGTVMPGGPQHVDRLIEFIVVQFGPMLTNLGIALTEQADPYDYGYVVGMVLYEFVEWVVLTATTAGLGAAVKSASVASLEIHLAAQVEDFKLGPAAVWKVKDTYRGILIERRLAQTEYASWFHVGETHRGYFPLVDFQKDLHFVSLKTIKTNGIGKGWLYDMRKHLDDLAVARFGVDDKIGSVVLDIRVQPGGLEAAQCLIEYGRKLGITVIIKEYP